MESREDGLSEREADAGNHSADVIEDYAGEMQGRMAVLGYYGAPNRHEMEQGDIHNLNVAGHVAVIYCRAGSRRSSHWHRRDEHYLFVVSGRMFYRERAVGSTEEPRRHIYRKGEQVHTGPNVEHWTEFPEDTVLVSVSRLHRSHGKHEQDLVRIPWLA